MCSLHSSATGERATRGGADDKDHDHAHDEERNVADATEDVGRDVCAEGGEEKSGSGDPENLGEQAGGGGLPYLNAV